MGIRTVRVTRTERDTLTFIRQQIRSQGYSPTLSEIAHFFGVSPVTILERVCRMQRKGVVTREEGRPRTLRVVDGIRVRVAA